MGEELVEHHIKYLERDGIDETVWVTRKEHLKLHRDLEKVGSDITTRAYNRTDKVKNAKKAYMREYQARKQIERAYIQGNEYRYMYGLDYQEDHFLKPLM